MPTPIVSRTGFQGCISSLETNGELIDPIRHALVPSHLVEEGCEGNVLYTILLASKIEGKNELIFHILKNNYHSTEPENDIMKSKV